MLQDVQLLHGPHDTNVDVACCYCQPLLAVRSSLDQHACVGCARPPWQHVDQGHTAAQLPDKWAVGTAPQAVWVCCSLQPDRLCVCTPGVFVCVCAPGIPALLLGTPVPAGQRGGGVGCHQPPLGRADQDMRHCGVC